MATEVERLAVLIEANTRSYENAMKKMQASTERAVKASARAVETLDARLKGLAVSAARSVAAFIGVGALSSLPTMFIDMAAAMEKLGASADKIGVTVEELQKLRYAGQQVGMDVEAVDEALAKFSRNLGEAAAGGAEKFRAILEANGIALRDAQGRMRPVIDLFAEYADVLKNAASQQDRNLLSTTAFGKANDEMGNLARDGASGVRAAADELVRIDGVIGAVDVERWKEIDDWFDRLSVAALKFGSDIGLRAAEGIKRYTDSMQELAGATEDLINNPSWAAFMRFLYGEHAGAVADFLGNPIHQPNRAAKGDFLGIVPPASTPATSLPSIIPPGVFGGGGRSKKETDLSGSADLTREAIERLDDSLRDTLQTGRDFAETIIQGMMDGKSATEALSSALSGLASKLLDSGLDALFGTGKTGGGLFSLLGGLGNSPTVPFSTPMFAEGGYLRPGQVGIAGEAGPELLYGGRSGISIAPMGGGAGGVTITTHIDARGAGPGVETKLLALLDARDKRLKDELPAVLRRHGMNRRRSA